MVSALRHILNAALWVPATHIYDDFSQVDARPFSLDICQATECLLSMLGWEFKADEDQLLPPAATFAPLAVSMDFSVPGVALVGNTAKRKERFRTGSHVFVPWTRFPQRPCIHS